MIKDGNEGVGGRVRPPHQTRCPVLPQALGIQARKAQECLPKWKGPCCRKEQLKQEGRVYGEHPPQRPYGHPPPLQSSPATCPGVTPRAPSAVEHL